MLNVPPLIFPSVTQYFTRHLPSCVSLLLAFISAPHPHPPIILKATLLFVSHSHLPALSLRPVVSFTRLCLITPLLSSSLMISCSFPHFLMLSSPLLFLSSTLALFIPSSHLFFCALIQPLCNFTFLVCLSASHIVPLLPLSPSTLRHIVFTSCFLICGCSCLLSSLTFCLFPSVPLYSALPSHNFSFIYFPPTHLPSLLNNFSVFLLTSLSKL